MSVWDNLPYGFTIRPVGVWPGAPTSSNLRGASPFSASLTTTVKQLAVELRALRAKDQILRVDIRESDLRIDGRPRVNAQALGPGVILNFQGYVDRTWTPLEYAADAFWQWRDNLRAIALTLNALRAVDRYGVTKRAEQYRGFHALPPAGTVLNGASAPMSVDDAYAFLEEHTGFRPMSKTTGAELRSLYLTAAKRLHPDVGGDERLWKRLQAAKEALEL